MVTKVTGVQLIARAALTARYSRPPRAKVAESARTLKELLADPWELFAYATLRALYVKPPHERVLSAAEAIKVAVPDPWSVVQLVGGPDAAPLREELAETRSQLEQAEEALKESSEAIEILQRRCAESEQEMVHLKQDWEQFSAAQQAATDEARRVARNLWSGMPAEGKLRYFESDEDWLPDWIRRR